MPVHIIRKSIFPTFSYFFLSVSFSINCVISFSLFFSLGIKICVSLKLRVVKNNNKYICGSEYDYGCCVDGIAGDCFVFNLIFFFYFSTSPNGKKNRKRK